MVVLFIVGNKSDLFGEEQVAESEGKSLAKENKASFLLTSAKENEGIPNILELIIKNCIKQYGEPETWNFREKDSDKFSIIHKTTLMIIKL